MTVERTRRALVAGALTLVLPSAAAERPIYVPLFRIERSKNANVVQYDAVLDRLDRLDPRSPVVAYWLMYAEDGRREGLGALDRRAYGFRVAPEKGGSWLLYLNATSDRSIRVLRWRGTWVAQIVIGGRSAILQRIYVRSDERGFIPRIVWIDLIGVDMVTGDRLTERLVP